MMVEVHRPRGKETLAYYDWKSSTLGKLYLFPSWPTYLDHLCVIHYIPAELGIASYYSCVQMMIQRMDGGRDSERLPVAHTRFNVLDLPPYPSQELMKQKLLQAINFTSGFGIV